MPEYPSLPYVQGEKGWQRKQRQILMAGRKKHGEIQIMQKELASVNEDLKNMHIDYLIASFQTAVDLLTTSQIVAPPSESEFARQKVNDSCDLTEELQNKVKALLAKVQIAETLESECAQLQRDIDKESSCADDVLNDKFASLEYLIRQQYNLVQRIPV